MPSLPPYLLSVSAFICQQILQEKDGVNSAIRLVDVFYAKLEESEASGKTTMIHAFCHIGLKAQIGHHGEHSARYYILNPQGESEPAEKGSAKISFVGRPDLSKSIPPGASLVIEFEVPVKDYGTRYLVFELDGEEIARVPFTVVSVALRKTDQ